MVEYARSRGVRVIVEFDVPGHAASWCTGYPEVCPSPDCQEPLNVASEDTFSLIGDILGEVTSLFPDHFVHLGGDEVDTACWSSSEEISAWLDAQGMTPDDGYAYFVQVAGPGAFPPSCHLERHHVSSPSLPRFFFLLLQRAAEIALAASRRPVQWSEVYDHFKTSLDPSTVVHVWKPETNG